MRFGVADTDSEDEVDSFALESGAADDSFDAESPVAKTHRRTLGSLLSDESDDDDVQHIGLARSVGPGARKGPLTPVSGPTWTARARGATVTLGVIGRPEEQSGYETWVQKTEEAAIRHGQQQAARRQKVLQEVAANTRSHLTQEEQARTTKLHEETAALLERLSIQSKQDEAVIVKDFEERKRRLWEDIDAAIAEVNKKQEAIAAAEKRLKDQQQAAADEKAKRAESARREEAAKKAEQEKQAADAQRSAVEAKEAEANRAADLRAKLEAAKAAQASAASTSATTGEAEWRRWVDKQRWMKSEVIDKVKADRPTRTALKVSMRLITRGIGQATNDKDDVKRLVNDFDGMLQEHLPAPPTPASPTRLDSSAPVHYLYMLSHASKAFIKQAEAEVSARADAAFPLARIIVALLLRGHAALGEVLFARFVKKCPWVVPYYPRKQPDQSREEYEKSTGRASDESTTEYVQRMAGTTSLYFAILQTPLAEMVTAFPSHPTPTPQQLSVLFPPVLRFNTAWTWLAAACHSPMPAYPPITHLLSCWLQILGAESIRTFGIKQVGKIMQALVDEGLTGGKLKGDSEASRQRLGQLLENWRAIKPHAGREWS